MVRFPNVGLSWLPSGKRFYNYGKSSCLMGKLTISMAIFNSFLYVYQRVHWVGYIWDLVGGFNPLKNDGVRQLGLLFPIWWESHNPAMFRTTNQIIYLYDIPKNIPIIFMGVIITRCYNGLETNLFRPRRRVLLPRHKAAQSRKHRRSEGIQRPLSQVTYDAAWVLGCLGGISRYILDLNNLMCTWLSRI